MKSGFKFLLLIVLLSLLTACNGGTNPIPDFKPTIPAPKAGTTIVVGRVLYDSSGLPYTKNYVALAEIHRNEFGDAVYALDTRTSPQTYTDAEGYFMFRDIPVTEYAFVVGDPMVQAIVLSEPSNGYTRILKPEADKALNIGVIRFEFPVQK